MPNLLDVSITSSTTLLCMTESATQRQCFQDVRLVGHWGSFLDAALAFSAHVPERFLFDDAATDSVSGETPMMTEEER